MTGPTVDDARAAAETLFENGLRQRAEIHIAPKEIRSVGDEVSR